MYANVRMPLTQVSTNWTYYFSLRYFNGIKIVTAFKCIFEDNRLKILEIIFPKTLTRSSIPFPSNFDVTNCSTVQWKMLIKFAAEVPYDIFLNGNTHTQKLLYQLRDHLIDASLVCLELVTMCWYGSIIKWYHHCTSVQRWAMHISVCWYSVQCTEMSSAHAFNQFCGLALPMSELKSLFLSASMISNLLLTML